MTFHDRVRAWSYQRARNERILSPNKKTHRRLAICQLLQRNLFRYDHYHGHISRSFKKWSGGLDAVNDNENMGCEAVETMTLEDEP